MREKRKQTWISAILLAFLVHLILFGLLALYLAPPKTILIVDAIPKANEEVQLSPKEALRAIIYFEKSQKLVKINPEAAQIYKISDDLSPQLIGSANRHPDNPFALQFIPIHEPGRYFVRVSANAPRAVEAPYHLDGEFTGTFPSGDGKAGGDFELYFTILEPKENLLVSAKYLEEISPAPAEKPSFETPPQAMKEESKPVKQKEIIQPAPPISEEIITEQEELAQATLPTADLSVREKKYREVLNFNADKINQGIYQEIENAAIHAFHARDENVMVASANDLQNKVNNAYLNRPTIGAGSLAEPVQFEKEVEEYIALMHKEIHPIWAHTYLIDLDLNPGRHDPRAQGDLSAITEITLDSLGKVINVSMIRTSGVAEFDNEAILVSWQSSPKIGLPKELKSESGKGYVHWTFWRDTRQCGTFGVKAFKLDKDRKNAIALKLHAIEKEEERLGIKDRRAPVRGEDLEIQKENTIKRIDPLQD